jgi:hypothetical protein
MRENVKEIILISLALIIGMMIGMGMMAYSFIYSFSSITENYRDCVSDWSDKMIDGIKCEKMLGQCVLKGSDGYE